MTQLILAHSGQKIGEYPLRKGSVLTVGSDGHCNIHIDSPDVAPRHCIIRENAGQFVIFDLGSEAGTYVNGERTRQGVLLLGDSIDFPEYRLIFLSTIEHQAVPHPVYGKADLDQTQYHETEIIAKPEQWRLTWVSKGKTCSEILADIVLIIGSRPDSDLMLPGRKVSAQHAALIKDRYGLRAVNISPNRKIKVNGKKASVRTILASGDVLDIGPYELTVSRDDSRG